MKPASFTPSEFSTDPFAPQQGTAELETLIHTGLCRGSCLAPCPKMEAPMERMPIACVHCAKAKAKCDKKVCSCFTPSQFACCCMRSTAAPSIKHRAQCLSRSCTNHVLLKGALLSVRHQAGIMSVEAYKKVVKHGLTPSKCSKNSSRELPFLWTFSSI
jgi:hypothetical protein